MSELHLDNWTSCHLARMGTGSTHIITLRFHGRGWRFIVYDGKRHLFSTMPEGPKGHDMALPGARLRCILYTSGLIIS